MKPYQLDLFIDGWFFNEPHAVIDQALDLLSKTFKKRDVTMDSSEAVKKYCRLKLASKEHEVFSVLFLDNQHRLIEFKELFRGTIDGCSVYIREAAKEALKRNSAAVIFAHNHPSCMFEPSHADIGITKELQKALGLFDVRVLDHLVVGVDGAVSLAERGLI